MPMVELVAKRALESNPNIGLSVIDLVVLLWLYSNPYDSKKRQLSSIRTVLKMCETLQTPGKGIDITGEEPIAPDLVIDNNGVAADIPDVAAHILERLRAGGGGVRRAG